MTKLLVYVLHHDVGFAPRIEEGTCILKGCMKNSIEKRAKVGDWIIGIGGVDTGSRIKDRGKYDRKLIYTMKVEENKNNAPKSKDFYYFGNKAIDFPEELKILAPFVRRFRKHYEENPEIISKFENFIRKQTKGVIGTPCDIQ